MSQHTTGTWRIPVANVFRILAIDANGEATKLIHDQPEMESWFGAERLEWQEDDGPEVVANTKLMAASPRMLDDLAMNLVQQGLDVDEVVATLTARYGITEDSARLALMNNGVLTWKE